MLPPGGRSARPVRDRSPPYGMRGVFRDRAHREPHRSRRGFPADRAGPGSPSNRRRWRPAGPLRGSRRRRARRAAVGCPRRHERRTPPGKVATGEYRLRGNRRLATPAPARTVWPPHWKRRSPPGRARRPRGRRPSRAPPAGPSILPRTERPARPPRESTRSTSLPAHRFPPASRRARGRHRCREGSRDRPIRRAEERAYTTLPRRCDEPARAPRDSDRRRPA